MNRKNKRVRDQIVDFLIGEFCYCDNWVKELEFDKDEDTIGGLSDSKIEELREILNYKLIKHQWINIRYPVILVFNNRLSKNLPSISVSIKINKSEIDINWKISDKFGKNNELVSLTETIKQLTYINSKLRNLEKFLHLTYNRGLFQKE